MRKPVVTITLIVFECIWFLLTLLCGTDYMFQMFGMYTGAGLDRMLTSPMIHSGIIHLVGNMICLWYFGNELECNIGHFKFYLLHLLCVITSGIMINICGGIAFHGGASGYIYGLMGAMLIYNRRYNLDNSGLIKCLILNIVISFMIPNISWQGHIGGLIGGLVFGLLLCKQKGISKSEWKKNHPTCDEIYYCK